MARECSEARTLANNLLLFVIQLLGFAVPLMVVFAINVHKEEKPDTLSVFGFTGVMLMLLYCASLVVVAVSGCFLWG